jgi:hypothetical protein
MEPTDLRKTEIIEMWNRMTRCKCPQCTQDAKELEEYYRDNFLRNDPRDIVNVVGLANN